MEILNSEKYQPLSEKEKDTIFKKVQNDLQNEIVIIDSTSKGSRIFSGRFVETLKYELDFLLPNQKYFDYFRSQDGRNLRGEGFEAPYRGRKVSGKPNLDYYDNR